MGNHIGGGKEARGFDILVDVIRQQNDWHNNGSQYLFYSEHFAGWEPGFFMFSWELES